MLTDKNGIKLQEGMFIKLTGCKTKGENNIYIIHADRNTSTEYYTADEYILYKVKLNGEPIENGYHIYFLDGINPQKQDKDLDFEVVTDLKKAKKEVNEYLKNRTAQEIVYSFTDIEKQDFSEIKQGLYINFVKPVQWRNHMYSQKGCYEITEIREQNEVMRFHLVDEKGQTVNCNINNQYQGRQILLTLTYKTLQQLFAEGYIKIQERHATTKGELAEQKKEEQTETIKADMEHETEKEITTESETIEQLTENNNTIEAITESLEPMAEEQNKGLIERKFYPINEDLAYYARQQWSFTDYVKGTITEDYKQDVEQIYTIVDKIAETRPEYIEQAEKLADRYSRKLAEWWNTKHNIDMMCPSVMICGSANFPTRKKEKQISRMDTHYKELDKIKYIESQLKKLLKSEVIIKSNDKNAIELLENKIKDLTEQKELMKDINKYYRKNKTLEGYTGNITDKLKQHINFIISQGWENGGLFDTSNINQQIKNAQDRLTTLQRAKEKGITEQTMTTSEGEELFKVVENTELMRLQLLFDGKPSDEIRDILKKNGFKWSPKNTAWQRQLTDNARYSLKRVTEQIKEIS